MDIHVRGRNFSCDEKDVRMRGCRPCVALSCVGFLRMYALHPRFATLISDGRESEKPPDGL